MKLGERAIRAGVAVSVRLGDDELEAIAERVVELLRVDGAGAGLIDAAEVARRLGISRATVYEKAEELGAVRIGRGSRARLRFDPNEIAQRLERFAASKRSPVVGKRATRPRTVGRRRRRSSADRAGLLPIRGEAPR
jgi:predicted DNA-binding transcriptional regulator AlpA